MYIERVYDRGLAQASYFVACQATAEAIVIDPRRDIDVYLDLAEREGFSITRVAETHVHADYLSGARELAAATGADLLLSGEGGESWRYRFDHTPLMDGDSFSVGKLAITVLHTPGHTPEHLSFVLSDTAAGDGPRMVFTGDFLFAGDVGRPDLLDEAAGYTDTRYLGAQQMFASLRKIETLPDDLLVWPGHGAGSACGKSLGAVPVSTLGFERRTNPAFQYTDEERFITWLLDGQPEAPRYFGSMKRLNIDRPRESVRSVPNDVVPLVDPNDLDPEATQIVDLRDAEAFAAVHIAGSINVPFSEDLSTWFGWLLDYDRDIAVVAAENERDAALRAFVRIGLDRVVAFIEPGQIVPGRIRNGDGAIRSVTPAEARPLIDNGLPVFDVRSQSEFDEGHIPSARNIHLGYLPDFDTEVDVNTAVLVNCQSGYRSSIAASVLLKKGYREVLNLAGGYDAWSA